MMEKDVFCMIVSGEIPSVKIWENDEFLAILDIHPKYPGSTLVIPKEHFSSNVFEMPDEKRNRLFDSVMIVEKMLKDALGVEKVALVIEGLGVNHAHVKLYPIYDETEGYITTELGQLATQEELKEMAEKIRKES